MSQTSSAESSYDLDRVGMLREVLEKAQFLSLVQQFEQHSAQVLEAARQEVERGVTAELAATLHGIMGAALNLGALRLGNECKALEQLVQRGEQAQWPALLAALTLRLKQDCAGLGAIF